MGDPIRAALRKKYIGKGFSPHHERTIGVNFAFIDSKIRDRELRFQIWDPADHLFKPNRRMYYHGSTGGIVVFDVRKQSSLSQVVEWTEEIWKYNGKGKIPIVVTGIENTSEGSSESQIINDHIKLLTEKLKEQSPVIKYVYSDLQNGEKSIDIILSFLGEIYFDSISQE